MRYGKINNTQRITQIVNDIRYTVVYQHLVHDDVQLASVHNMHAYVICPRHRHTHTHPHSPISYVLTYSCFCTINRMLRATCDEATKRRSTESLCIDSCGRYFSNLANSSQHGSCRSSRRRLLFRCCCSSHQERVRSRNSKISLPQPFGGMCTILGKVDHFLKAHSL